jgi:hypothetical protein
MKMAPEKAINPADWPDKIKMPRQRKDQSENDTTF